MRIPRLRLPRATIRLRLTLLYGALFLASGAALLGVTNLLVNARGGPLVYRAPEGDVVVNFEPGGFGFGGGVIGPRAIVIAESPPPLGAASASGGPPTGTFSSEVVPPDPAAMQAQLQQFRYLAEQQHAAEQAQFLIWSGVALALMAVVALGFGWVVAGRLLAPLRTMTADVRQISATNLHRHLTLDGPDDELTDLGRTFNDLLDRLVRSFDAQRQFVANASHELRTPLARQRTLLQVALADPDVSVDSLRAACERTLVAGDQQEKLIEALFTLARGERGLERREPLDLATVADEVLEARRAEAEGHGLRVDSRLDPAPVSGDKHLLERLVANLVDNAVRYNTAPGWIVVTTGTRVGSAVLRMANSGPVVPATQVDRIFQPFQRLGDDRTRHGDGWGMGLSIVRAIAGAHDARVVAEARAEGGLDIVVIFPAEPAQPPVPRSASGP